MNQEWRFKGTRAEESQVLRPFHGKPTGQEDAQRCPERSEDSESQVSDVEKHVINFDIWI